MYKIIVCDLDETLISRNRTISNENIEAIRKATEAGVKLFHVREEDIILFIIQLHS